MSRQIQKHRERYYLNILSELSDLPGIESENRHSSPDFLFNDNGVVTGIELTELKQPSSVELKGLQRQIVRRAKEQAEKDSLPTLEVFVNFNDAYKRYPNKGQTASSALYDAIRANIDRIEEQGGASVEVPSPDPFVGIDLIHARSGRHTGKQWLDHHRWGLFEVGFVARTFDENLKARIEEKNKRYPEYCKWCDRCWLVVVVDRYLADAKFAVSENQGYLSRQSFGSKFDRTFVLDVAERVVVEL